MYKLEFLPLAKNDMDDIIYYISHNLKNIRAAKNLAENFIKEAYNILEFPYSNVEYCSEKHLEKVYRYYKVKNFLMFYTIDEENKIVTIVRVLYQKRDINRFLD